MAVYVTKQGDMWDQIAYEQLGSESYMGILIEKNPDLIDVVIFPSGIEIQLPEISHDEVDYPSWRSGLDGEEDDLDEVEEDEEDS